MKTIFTIQDGYVIVGRAACQRCMGRGEVLAVTDCMTCDGSGRGAKGGEGGCKECDGRGLVWGPDYETCPTCRGNDPESFEPGRITDPVPWGILSKIPVEYWDHNPAPGGKIIEHHDPLGRTRSFPPEKMVVLAQLHLMKDGTTMDKITLDTGTGYQLAHKIIVYHDAYGYVIKPWWTGYVG